MTSETVKRRDKKNPQPKKAVETKRGNRTANHCNGFQKEHIEQAMEIWEKRRGERKKKVTFMQVRAISRAWN